MTISPYHAVARMKQLTEAGVSFSFTFSAIDTTRDKCSGFKRVEKAMLRKSMREDQSDLSHQLISYIDINQGDVPRQFYLSQLIKFNEYTIQP